MSQMKVATKVDLPIEAEAVLSSRHLEIRDNESDFYQSPISINHKYVSCDGVKLNIWGREKTMKLFLSFGARGDKMLSRFELLESVYGIRGGSPRLISSSFHSLIKLISRTRKEVEQRFGGAEGRYEWFHYNFRNGLWQLFRLKPDSDRSTLN